MKGQLIQPFSPGSFRAGWPGISGGAASAAGRTAARDAAIDNFKGYFDIQRANVVELSGLFATADQPENRRQIPLLLYKARADLRLRQSNYSYFFDRFDEFSSGPNSRKLTVSGDPNRLCSALGSQPP